MDDIDAFLDSPSNTSTTVPMPPSGTPPSSPQGGADEIDAFLDSPAPKPSYELSDVASNVYNKIKSGASYAVNNPVEAMRSVSQGADKIASDIYNNPADAAMSAASGIVRTVPQTIDMAGAVLAKGANYAGQKAGVSAPVPFSDYLEQAPLDKATTAVVGQEYQPKTAGGEAVKIAAGFVSPGGYVKGASALAKGGKLAAEGAEATVKPITAAIKDIRTGAGARAGDELEKSAAAIKKQSQDTYTAMKNIGAELTPTAMQKVATNVEKEIQASGKTNASIHGKTLGALQDLKDAAQSGSLSLEELDLYRQLFKDAAKGFDADAQRASVGIQAIDDVVNRIGASDLQKGGPEAITLLRQARRQRQQKSKFDAVANIVQKAEGDPQKLKTMAKNFLADKRKTRGWSGEEKDAMRSLAQRGGLSGALKIGGSFGFDGSSVLRNVVAGTTAASGALTGGLGTAVALGSTGIRQLEKLLGRGRAENILQLIEKGADPATIQRTIQGQARTSAVANRAMQILGKSNSQGAPVPSAVFGGSSAAIKPETPITRSPAPVDTINNQSGSLQADPKTMLMGGAGAVAAGAAAQKIQNDREGKSTPQFIDKVIKNESSGKSDARPIDKTTGKPLSSALGAGQFINSTWIPLISKNRPDLVEGKTKKEILDLRKDPAISRDAIGWYADENAPILSSNNVPVNDTNLYLAHFLGPQTASKLLNADPKAPVLQIVGKNAVASNKSFLSGKRVSDVLSLARKKMAG